MATTIYISYFNAFGIKSKTKNWHFEESRIKGAYNATSINLGVRAYLVNEDYARQSRGNTMTYSGIYNSRTGVNDTNVFNIGKDITKSVDSAYGDINKLHAEESNLLIIQEDKTSQALIDKDAIFTAEGRPIQSSSNVVIGQIVPYAGEYGTVNPESFAFYGGRKYWVDKNRNAVIRLSRDGVTEISNYGMKDFFRDELAKTDLAVGSYDAYKKHYIVSLQGAQISGVGDNTFHTVNFNETNNGWITFYTFRPAFGGSLNGQYYTLRKKEDADGQEDLSIWKHHAGSTVNSFYGQAAIKSRIKLVMNTGPSDIKMFKTISYEGDTDWRVFSISTDSDTGHSILPYSLPTTPTLLDSYFLRNQFQKQHNKYFAWIKNNNPQTSLDGAVLGWGDDHSITGIKGAFMEVELLQDNTTVKKELFAVDSNVEKVN